MLIARDIMSAPVQTVTAHTSVHDLAMLLSSKRISGVPVLSDDGAVIGIATDADLLGRPGVTAGEIMTPSVVSVSEDTPVQEIAHLLGKLRITGVPVMRGQALVGMVSRGDIVRAIAHAELPESVIGVEG